MKSPYFNFKHFRVRHDRSAMKIGVDSVLLGGWVSLEETESLLDVGTGCGILALMGAQRSNSLVCNAIEIEPDAVSDARDNFSQSPWADRLHLTDGDFLSFAKAPENVGRFDLIISNPPYFQSGKDSEESPRMLARHQGGLSPFSIIELGASMLKPGGRIAMILPIEFLLSILRSAEELRMNVRRLNSVRAHPKAPVKRLLMELVKGKMKEPVPPLEELTLESSPGVPMPWYRELLKDFYLKF